MSRIVGAVLASLIAIAAAAPASAGGPGPVGRADIERSELNCLALNIYFEARGEPLQGMLAVGHVVMNRVASPRFPRRVCGVVKQGGFKQRHRCQFSWWCDGQSDRPRNRRAWKEAIFAAKLIRRGMTADPTRGALWYHADYVAPIWSQDFDRSSRLRIGRHIFYGADAPQGTRLAGRVCLPELPARALLA
jgi:spore germination cell wall hydrolase CwlJ-like protein